MSGHDRITDNNFPSEIDNDYPSMAHDILPNYFETAMGEGFFPFSRDDLEGFSYLDHLAPESSQRIELSGTTLHFDNPLQNFETRNDIHLEDELNFGGLPADFNRKSLPSRSIEPEISNDRKSRRDAIMSRRYPCRICTERLFGSRHDLRRHFSDVHHMNLEDNSPIALIYCPVSSCKRHHDGFTRQYNFKQHMIRTHKRHPESVERAKALDDEPDGLDFQTLNEQISRVIQHTKDIEQSSLGIEYMDIAGPREIPSNLDPSIKQEEIVERDYETASGSSDSGHATIADSKLEINKPSVPLSTSTSIPIPLFKKFASEIARIVTVLTAEEALIHKVSQILPDLLKTFALKIGYNAPDQLHKEVAHLVYRNCRLIRLLFEKLIQRRSEDQKIDVPIETSSKHFAINRFLEEATNKVVIDEIVQDTLPTVLEDELSDDYDLEGTKSNEFASNLDPTSATKISSDDNDYTQTMAEYFEFMVACPEFQWLMGSIYAHIDLTWEESQVMESVRAQIGSMLPVNEEINSISSIKGYRAVFRLNWYPSLFIREQRYKEGLDALSLAITLTGSSNDAQVLSVASYLHQLWPSSSKQLLNLIQDLGRGRNHKSKSQDRSELSAISNTSGCIIVAVGPVELVIETAQQIAWLGGALRSSPYTSGVVLCEPSISGIALVRAGSQNVIGTAPPDVTATIQCDIDFAIKKSDTASQGTCWHEMLRNPVIVTGFPIRRKPPMLGLELPLNVLTKLVGTDRVTEFDGMSYLKGFSTMAVGVKCLGEILVWHYLYKPREKKISYLDHDIAKPDSFDLAPTSRHIIGWCSSCAYRTGAVDAHPVEKTRLPRRQEGTYLQSATLSFGRHVTGGMNFAVGRRDIPLQLSTSQYILALRQMEGTFVVLWDEADQRGWLVNGVSALLHLVRTALRKMKEGKFAKVCIFDQERLREAIDPDTSGSALEVLLDDDNRDLPIFAGRTKKRSSERSDERGVEAIQVKDREEYYFEDLVMDLYNYLDQIFTYETSRRGSIGKEMKMHIRRRVEGWDFVELATSRRPNPRSMELEAGGWGWLDFVRAIDAVVLFGYKFGELLLPNHDEGLCPEWRRLPRYMAYLAVDADDLQEIVEQCGDEFASPIRLATDLVWHSPVEPVRPCRCRDEARNMPKSKKRVDHHNPVQLTLPAELMVVRTVTAPEQLPRRGALVFGHQFRLPDEGNEKRDKSVHAKRWQERQLRLPDSSIQGQAGPSASSPSSHSQAETGYSSRAGASHMSPATSESENLASEAHSLQQFTDDTRRDSRRRRSKRPKLQ